MEISFPDTFGMMVNHVVNLSRVANVQGLSRKMISEVECKHVAFSFNWIFVSITSIRFGELLRTSTLITHGSSAWIVVLFSNMSTHNINDALKNAHLAVNADITVIGNDFNTCVS